MDSIQKEQFKTSLIKHYGEVLTTGEATGKYTFKWFMAPYAGVTHKATGKTGTLQFTHDPRFYFNFK